MVLIAPHMPWELGQNETQWMCFFAEGKQAIDESEESSYMAKKRKLENFMHAMRQGAQ